MSEINNDLEVYARVDEDDNIIEYPVYALHIRNRAHPFDWYTKVKYDKKPVLPEFCFLKETPVCKDGTVTVHYTVIPYTFDQLSHKVYMDHQMQNQMTGFNPEAVVMITDVDQATANQLLLLAKNVVQEVLDTFAQSKGYDGILSACSYDADPDPNFAAEGLKAKQVRSSVWSSLIAYFAKITSGEEAIPKSSKDIKAILPELVW